MKFSGCYTALVTPFTQKSEIDWEGLRSLVEFQRESGVQGVVAVGTTGESPTLTWDEHLHVIDEVADLCRGDLSVVGGTGSNNTEEALYGTSEAFHSGVDAVLLVDPYYNGPSSIELRREYYQPIAEALPECSLIPYLIPARTGTQLLPEDLALLHQQFPNVCGVKDATGSLENAARVRKLCGGEFAVLSGDDSTAIDWILDSKIAANGVVSVASNIVPRAMARLCSAAIEKDMRASTIAKKLEPLFSIVTLRTEEKSPLGQISIKARNPLPIKTLMSVLGMPSGPCRRPLGRLTQNALQKVLHAAREVWQHYPEALEPLESAFDVDIDDRLYNPLRWDGLAYETY